MCGFGGRGSTPAAPAAPRIEPLKQAVPDDAASRDRTLRRLLRRYSINRTRLSDPASPASSLNPTNASLPGVLPGGKSMLGQ